LLRLRPRKDVPDNQSQGREAKELERHYTGLGQQWARWASHWGLFLVSVIAQSRIVIDPHLTS
jgi:hypothetical protein